MGRRYNRRMWLTFLFACAPPSEHVDGSFDLKLDFPVLEVEMLEPSAMGMDHDPDPYEGVMAVVCTNYNGDGFPFCYDGHSGTDTR